MNTHSIFDLLDIAKASPVYRYEHPTYLNSCLPKSGVEALRDSVDTLLSRYNAQVPSYVITRTRKWIDDYEAQATRVPDPTHGFRMEVRLNLVKALLLPGVDAAAELEELRGFLLACKAFVDEQGGSERRAAVQLYNARDRTGKVYLGIDCGAEGSPARNGEFAENAEKLKSMVAASPTLSHWARAVALGLGKLGPHSWWTMSERTFYAERERPFEKALRKKIEQELDAEDALQASQQKQSGAAPAP